MSSITKAGQLRDLARATMVAASDATGQALADKVFSRHYLSAYVPTIAAGTTFALVLDIAAVDFIVDSVKIIPAAALTADDTNYATLTLSYDDGAGGGKTTIASQTTKITGGSGNWTAEVGQVLTVTAANAYVAAGKQVTLSKAVAGTGVAIPPGCLVMVQGYYV